MISHTGYTFDNDINYSVLFTKDCNQLCWVPAGNKEGIFVIIDLDKTRHPKNLMTGQGQCSLGFEDNPFICSLKYQQRLRWNSCQEPSNGCVLETPQFSQCRLWKEIDLQSYWRHWRISIRCYW